MKNIIKLFVITGILLSPFYAAKNLDKTNPQNSQEIILKERAGKKSIVSELEYQQASDFTKRMINQIDSAIAALEILGANEANADFEALVSISKDEHDKFRNAIIISKPENETEAPPSDSYSICGLGNTHEFLEKIKAYEFSKEDFSIKVKSIREGCVTLSWEY